MVPLKAIRGIETGTIMIAPDPDGNAQQTRAPEVKDESMIKGSKPCKVDKLPPHYVLVCDGEHRFMHFGTRIGDWLFTVAHAIRPEASPVDLFLVNPNKKAEVKYTFDPAKSIYIRGRDVTHDVLAIKLTDEWKQVGIQKMSITSRAYEHLEFVSYSVEPDEDGNYCYNSYTGCLTGKASVEAVRKARAVYHTASSKEGSCGIVSPCGVMHVAGMKNGQYNVGIDLSELFRHEQVGIKKAHLKYSGQSPVMDESDMKRRDYYYDDYSDDFEDRYEMQFRDPFVEEILSKRDYEPKGNRWGSEEDSWSVADEALETSAPPPQQDFRPSPAEATQKCSPAGDTSTKPAKKTQDSKTAQSSVPVSNAAGTGGGKDSAKSRTKSRKSPQNSTTTGGPQKGQKHSSDQSTTSSGQKADDSASPMTELMRTMSEMKEELTQLKKAEAKRKKNAQRKARARARDAKDKSPAPAQS
jgi:hypothetical protein